MHHCGIYYQGSVLHAHARRHAVPGPRQPARRLPADGVLGQMIIRCTSAPFTPPRASRRQFQAQLAWPVAAGSTMGTRRPAACTPGVCRRAVGRETGHHRRRRRDPARRRAASTWCWSPLACPISLWHRAILGQHAISMAVSCVAEPPCSVKDPKPLDTPVRRRARTTQLSRTATTACGCCSGWRTASPTGLDWFTVPDTDRTEVWTNVLAQQRHVQGRRLEVGHRPWPTRSRSSS
jgi:hypothetical protein